MPKDVDSPDGTIAAEPGACPAGEGRGAPSPADADRDDLRQLMEDLPLWRRPGYLIRRVHQLHYSLFFEECGTTDITPVQYGLLTILSTHPDIDQVAIAGKLGIDRTNVADVLKRLERGGLVERRRSERDRRAILARLTPEGTALLQRMYPAMSRAQQRLLACLDEEGRTRFVDTLIAIIEANNQFGRSSLRTEVGGAAEPPPDP